MYFHIKNSNFDNILNISDMHQCELVYWCCALLTLVGNISAFYIPRMKSSTTSGRDLDIAALRSKILGSSDVHWNKRNGFYGSFADSLNKHASQYDERNVFFQDLFALFDMNDNGCIDQFEFEDQPVRKPPTSKPGVEYLKTYNLNYVPSHFGDKGHRKGSTWGRQKQVSNYYLKNQNTEVNKFDSTQKIIECVCSSLQFKC